MTQNDGIVYPAREEAARRLAGIFPVHLHGGPAEVARQTKRLNEAQASGNGARVLYARNELERLAAGDVLNRKIVDDHDYADSLLPAGSRRSPIPGMTGEEFDARIEYRMGDGYDAAEALRQITPFIGLRGVGFKDVREYADHMADIRAGRKPSFEQRMQAMRDAAAARWDAPAE